MQVLSEVSVQHLSVMRSLLASLLNELVLSAHVTKL